MGEGGLLPEVKRAHQQRSLLTVGVNGYHLLTGFTVLSKAMRHNSHQQNHMLMRVDRFCTQSRHFL